MGGIIWLPLDISSMQHLNVDNVKKKAYNMCKNGGKGGVIMPTSKIKFIETACPRFVYKSCSYV